MNEVSTIPSGYTNLLRVHVAFGLIIIHFRLRVHNFFSLINLYYKILFLCHFIMSSVWRFFIFLYQNLIENINLRIFCSQNVFFGQLFTKSFKISADFIKSIKIIGNNIFNFLSCYILVFRFHFFLAFVIIYFYKIYNLNVS